MDYPDVDAYPPALHAKVAAAEAAWKIAVCARHAVVPEHYWPHEVDRSALRAAKALSELTARYLERAVVSARADGLGWQEIGDALGNLSPEATYGAAVSGWEEELALVRKNSRTGVPAPDRSAPALKWVVDTPWWTEALREWLTSPGKNILDNAATQAPPGGAGLWNVGGDQRDATTDDCSGVLP